MFRPAFLAAAFLLIAISSALADDTAPVAFPDGWFSLEAEEAGIVFMLRSYGADMRFEIVDEIGGIVDEVALPKGRTVVSQYRVSPGEIPVRVFDKDMKAKARAGLFAACGVAVTHVPAADGKAETFWPDYAPFATYTPVSMEQRVTPLAELGTTDFLPPKRLTATALEIRMSGAGAPLP